VKRLRQVNIMDCAVEWLLPHAVGKLRVGRWRRDFDAVKTSSFKNGLQSTCLPEDRQRTQAAEEAEGLATDAIRPAIGYHQHGDEGKTATWAGNSVQMIRSLPERRKHHRTQRLRGLVPGNGDIIPLPKSATA
jgi:hypothetical protein